LIESGVKGSFSTSGPAAPPSAGAAAELVALFTRSFMVPLELAAGLTALLGLAGACASNAVRMIRGRFMDVSP
jgi:hypothetical protein